MSADLLRQLQVLEADYSGQPIVVQRADLREINALRSRLGMRPVDGHLHEIGAAAVADTPAPARKLAPDHSEARALYAEYVKKVAELAVYQAYAEKVAKATSGPGMTPVRPLATMGTDGGALLCDHCGKPIVLEGGQYNGVPVDVAWRRSTHKDKWVSWIAGGMVVEIQTNGTLRIYHGYPGRDNKHCCNAARRQDDAARDAFGPKDRTAKFHQILAFLESEFPERTEKEQLAVLNDVLDLMFSYDPGLGVNRPPRAG